MTSDEDRQRMDANRFGEEYVADREAVMEERNYRSPAQIRATKDEITRRLKSAYNEAVKSEIQKWNAEVQDGEQDVKDVKQWAKKFSDNTWYHIGKDAVSMMGNVKSHVCGDDWNGKMDDCFITKYVKVKETYSTSGAAGREIVSRRSQESINMEDPRVIADLAANRKAPFCAMAMAGKLESAKVYWDKLRSSKRGGFTVEDVLSNGEYADFVKTGHECYSEIGNMITGDQGRGFGRWLTEDEFNIKMIAEKFGGIKDDMISGDIVGRLEHDHDSVIGIDHIMIYTAEGMREMKLRGSEGWKELGKTRLDQMLKELSSATMKEAGKIAGTMDLTGLQEGDFPTPEEFVPIPGGTSGKGRNVDQSKNAQQDVEDTMDLELSWGDE